MTPEWFEDIDGAQPWVKAPCTIRVVDLPEKTKTEFRGVEKDTWRIPCDLLIGDTWSPEHFFDTTSIKFMRQLKAIYMSKGDILDAVIHIDKEGSGMATIYALEFIQFEHDRPHRHERI